MNFSCGVNFDPTLVLTHWILTLAIQGLIVTVCVVRVYVQCSKRLSSLHGAQHECLSS